MANVKMICWDMDGTIADLYGVPEWAKMLSHSIVCPYVIAKPMWDMEELARLLNELRKQGIEIRIVTHLAIGADEDYKARTKTAKKEWLAEYGFPYDHFHGLKYGNSKADAVRKYLAEDETAILIDDNATVRNSWHLGETIDPTAVNIIEVLKNLLN